jgi:hypothetical protein
MFLTQMLATIGVLASLLSSIDTKLEVHDEKLLTIQSSVSHYEANREIQASTRTTVENLARQVEKIDQRLQNNN